MIHVHRIPIPPILAVNSDMWRNTYLAKRKIFTANPSVATRKKMISAGKKYNQRQVKEALRQMFSDKCAYCESHITHIDFGEIEHFRPKSTFPHLCFDWDNLLLGCSVCNGAQFKGNNFPEEVENGPIVNPVTDNPGDFLAFEYDPNSGTANILEIHHRGKTTVNVLGLNRRELVRHRSDVVRKIAFVAIKAKKGDHEAIDELNRCCEKDQEYAAFARSLKAHFGI